jgi:serine/threonine protein phosphatase PrpC
MEVHSLGNEKSMKAAWKSDIGKVRENNEDNVLVDPPRGIFLLADGMGGASGGEIASALAVSAAYDFLRGRVDQADSSSLPKLLAEALASAHAAVYKGALNDPALAGMGTTLEIVVVKEGAACICHLGDSRVYLMKDGELRQITTDDNLAAYLVHEEHVPPEKVPPGAQHMLTQAVGSSETLIPELHTVEAHGGDILVICSDGLTGMLADREIAEIVLHRRDDLDKAAADLVREANARGGSDNVSVVLVDAWHLASSSRKKLL